MTTAPVRKHFSSSILLWMRTDQPRKTGMDHWKGPHSGNEKTWDTPHVAHDNPVDQRYHASLVLGFADPAARTAFFQGTQAQELSPMLARVASAVHGYDVSATLTFVEGGQVLPHYHQ